MRFSIEQLPAHLREQAQAKLAAAGTIRINKFGVVKRKPVEDHGNKYNAQRVKADGHNFASKAEYTFYRGLRVRERAGEISGLRVHVKFALFDPGENCRGEYICTYTCDYVYKENGKLVVADKKSPATRARRDWPRTQALMRACHGVEVLEV